MISKIIGANIEYRCGWTKFLDHVSPSLFQAEQAVITNSHEEFWYFVSPQERLPLAGSIKTDIDIPRIREFFKHVGKISKNEVQQEITKRLLKDPSLFHDVRQFLGLSDKRAYLDLSYIASRLSHPNNQTSLCGCQPWNLSKHPLEFFLSLLHVKKPTSVRNAAAEMLSDYLLTHGLGSAAGSFAELSPDALQLLYTRLISPKEYQQRAAKRRGHGCEAALAQVLINLGLRILPEDKATNPMGARDPNLDLKHMTIQPRKAGSTYSFDAVVFNEGDPRVLIQSLIHTSDPGQYGVSKSDETVSIAKRITKWTESKPGLPIELWGLFDGVGFCENKPQTINKLLRNVEQFIQLRTLFKACLRAHCIGLTRIISIKFDKTISSDVLDYIIKTHVPHDVVVVGEKMTIPHLVKGRVFTAGLAEISIAN